MDETAHFAVVRAPAHADAGRFDLVSIALHWATVLLVITQFATAWFFGQSHDAATLALHRSTGVTIFAVMTVRLVWRRCFAYLPPFPNGMPRLQQRLATLNEYGLYAFLLLQPLTGAGDTLLRGRPVTLLVWQVPALLPHNSEMQGLAHELHAWGAKAILALIGIHVAAALLHGLILRDGVFSRMLPAFVRSDLS